jgi:hypothetical protein
VKYRLPIVFVLLSLVSSAPAQDAPHYGIPIDWSSHHVISSAADNVDLQQAIRRDPRQVYNWMLHNRGRAQQMMALRPQGTATKATTTKKGVTSVDWSFPLGNGTVPLHAYPAKYSFDTTSAQASCTNDYIVYGLAVGGTSSQPNLVRLNNIYAGTGGLCGSVPTLESAYNVTTVSGGIVETSPALSYDGTEVAFIESGSGASVFHVLTWGTTGNNGTFTSNLYTAVAPGGGVNNASMTSLSYSSSSTTYSSPYIDYLGDRAFFGDDNGNIYVTTCVFRCVSAPAIATGWPVTVAAGVKMSPPVWDSTSNKIFVGGSNGKLYSLDLATCPSTCIPGSITVGANNANGGVFDGILLDSTFETLFAFAGDSGTGNKNGVMVQTDVNFSFTITFSFGAPPFPIYAGVLDDAYYQNAIGNATVSGNIFSCGALGGSNQPDLYWVTMAKLTGNLSVTNPPKMNGPNSKVNVPGNPGIGCNPLTEFKNGTTDRLFLSQSSLPNNKCVNGQAANGCAMMYNITTPNGAGSTIGAAPAAAAIESAGTSGMVVDNVLADTQQGSSIYFSNLGTTQCTTGTGLGTTPSYCAVKLTQTLFQ